MMSDYDDLIRRAENHFEWQAPNIMRELVAALKVEREYGEAAYARLDAAKRRADREYAIAEKWHDAARDAKQKLARAVEALREAEQQATGRTHDIIARALADIEGADHA